MFLSPEHGNFYEFTHPLCGENEIYLWLKILHFLRNDITVPVEQVHIRSYRLAEPGLVVPFREFGVGNGVCIDSKNGNFAGYLVQSALSGGAVAGRILTVDGGDLVPERMLESLEKKPLPVDIGTALTEIIGGLEPNWYAQAMHAGLRAVGVPVTGAFVSNIARVNLKYF